MQTLKNIYTIILVKYLILLILFGYFIVEKR